MVTDMEESLVSFPDCPPLHTWKADLTLRSQGNIALVQTSPLKHPSHPQRNRGLPPDSHDTQC